MKIIGSEAKELFNSPKGVVIFDGQTLRFVNCKTMKISYHYDEESKKMGEKKIVIGKNFDLIKMLENDKEYKIEIVGRFIIFRDSQTDELKLVIEGETSY